MGLFKDIDFEPCGSQDFLSQPLSIDISASAVLLSATSVIWFQVIESFLSKEVSYIVSSRREAKAESSGSSLKVCLSPGEVGVEIPPSVDARGSHSRPAQVLTDSVRTPNTLWKKRLFAPETWALGALSGHLASLCTWP